ncbi:MAG: carboxylating nicotinate-nucleotide diphosphorylase [Candidatus Omnitrophota bacterium]
MNIPNQKILPLIKYALKEDIGPGDITSKLALPDNKNIKAEITAKESGIACGLEVVKLIFNTIDPKIKFFSQVQDGQKINTGQILAGITGPVSSILMGERVALNFLGRLCGIASKTAEYIEKVRPYPVKILDTRKTTPGLRILEKYAVRCGGGTNHRMGLWDQILLKDNHLAILNPRSTYSPQIKNIILKAKANRPRGMKIVVEVKNLREFREALEAGPDIILLDNMSLKDIKKAVEIRNQAPGTKLQAPELEVSGRVNLNNARGIAACGVERISIGALTHSVQALDVSLNYCE